MVDILPIKPNKPSMIENVSVVVSTVITSQEFPPRPKVI